MGKAPVRKSPEEVDLLARAIEALEASTPHEALDPLLQAWRASPSSRLGNILDRFSQIDAEPQGLPGKTAKARHEAWLAVARERRPADVGRLVGLLLDGVKSPEAATRLDALREFPPDPRIASALAGLAARPPFQAGTTRPFWKKLYPLLVAHANPRTVARLAPLSEKYVQLVGAVAMGTYMKNQLDAALMALRGLFTDGPPTPTEEATPLLARLETLLPASSKEAPATLPTEATFLRDIAADPDGDGPRLVYADWLQENGNARGEFIALQFRRHRENGLPPKEDAREASLLAKHRREWLGPLYKALLPLWSTCRFERGFLHVAQFCPTPVLLESALGSPLWTTVEELFIAPRPFSYVPLFETPVFGALRRLRSALPDTVAALLRSGVAPRLEDLHCLTISRAAAEDLGRLESLRSLSIEGVEGPSLSAKDYEWMLKLPVVEQLSSLSARVDLSSLVLEQALRAVVAPALALVLKVGITLYGTIHLPRAADGQRSEVVLDLTGVHESYVRSTMNPPLAAAAQLARALRGLGQQAPKTVCIRGVANALREDVAKTLEEIPRIAVV